jgi:hypothetical protein
MPDTPPFRLLTAEEYERLSIAEKIDYLKQAIEAKDGGRLVSPFPLAGAPAQTGR